MSSRTLLTASKVEDMYQLQRRRDLYDGLRTIDRWKPMEHKGDLWNSFRISRTSSDKGLPILTILSVVLSIPFEVKPVRAHLGPKEMLLASQAPLRLVWCCTTPVFHHILAARLIAFLAKPGGFPEFAPHEQIISAGERRLLRGFRICIRASAPPELGSASIGGLEL
ncbi:hypothetical protein HETIRDRAFT_105214 [Heterobasidion irregulare TC 32-1]|uniref:Uncharacterized protein n=1 Tax=Heterobasidion irregulare (strain TC 32-1) TaxID=747525 RepID=W4K4L5_HETIT|nr:uncharacterized protein HETIRDRAFT_105214 [Heterobasidion irregulare TC 32-1]ETW80275.1 hypothetical protein HETIRDRAFT_105214 [Heterobasidion irregulare TC 32-1]